MATASDARIVSVAMAILRAGRCFRRFEDGTDGPPSTVRGDAVGAGPPLPAGPLRSFVRFKFFLRSRSRPYSSPPPSYLTGTGCFQGRRSLTVGSVDVAIQGRSAG